MAESSAPDHLLSIVDKICYENLSSMRHVKGKLVSSLFTIFFPKTVARDQGHSDPETIYDTVLPQGVSTNQSLESYVNWAASKQNLSSGFPTK